MFIIPCCEKPNVKTVKTSLLDGSKELIHSICLNCGNGEQTYRTWLNE